LAASPQEYAQALSTVLSRPDSDAGVLAMRRAARESVRRFSDQSFSHRFCELVRPFLEQLNP
jgi:hypothetical protein